MLDSELSFHSRILKKNILWFRWKQLIQLMSMWLTLIVNYNTFQLQQMLSALRFIQKYINLCSKDERKSYRVGTSLHEGDRIFVFGWTNRLTNFRPHWHLLRTPKHTDWNVFLFLFFFFHCRNKCQTSLEKKHYSE